MTSTVLRLDAGFISGGMLVGLSNKHATAKRGTSLGARCMLLMNILFTSAKEVMFSSLFVCLSVCLLATLRRNFATDLHEIFTEGRQ